MIQMVCFPTDKGHGPRKAAAKEALWTAGCSLQWHLHRQHLQEGEKPVEFQLLPGQFPACVAARPG